MLGALLSSIESSLLPYSAVNMIEAQGAHKHCAKEKQLVGVVSEHIPASAGAETPTQHSLPDFRV